MGDSSSAPGADPYGQDQFTDARAGRRPMAELVDGLTRWYRSGPPGRPSATATDVVVPGGGASSDLFLVRIEDPTAGPTRVAVRLAPTYNVYPVVDLSLQFRVSTAAYRHSAAPIPEPQWHEEDPTWLGAAFIVTEAAPGVVGGDVGQGWTTSLPPAEQRLVWERSIDALAALHACDVAAAGLAEATLPAPGATSLERALNYWDRYLDLVGGGEQFPLLATAVDRLRAEQPSTVLGDTIVWGDARLGNMLFVDGRPSALLDFEFSHVGLREFDIAFFSIFDTILARHFLQTDRLPGFPGHDETLDYYEAVSGCRIGDREYFTLMACTYSALATTRVLQGRAAAGYVDPAFVRRHGPMAALAELLGRPLPD